MSLEVLDDSAASARLGRVVRSYLWSGGDPKALIQALQRDAIDVAVVTAPLAEVGLLARLRRLTDDVQVLAIQEASWTLHVGLQRVWQGDLGHAVWTDVLEVDDATIRQFAEASGDRNPVHLDADAARAAGFPDRILHGAWVVAHASEIMGMHVPGPGTILLDLSVRFVAPLVLGQTFDFALFADLTARANLPQVMTFLVRDRSTGQDCATGRATVLVRKV